MMQRLFGTKKEAEVPKPPEPVKKEEPAKPPVDLVDQSKKLETRIQEISGVVAGLDRDLKDLYPKMKAAKGSNQTFYKQRILNLMKKRKMYQQQCDNLLGQQISIDSVAFTKEAITNSIECAQALKEAVKTQKEAMADLDVDQLADLRDEMADLQYESQDIQDLLSRDYAVDVDESELDDELRELDNGNFLDQLSSEKPVEKQATTNAFAEALSKSQVQKTS
jgi:charged multivesicular body protein 5